MYDVLVLLHLALSIQSHALVQVVLVLLALLASTSGAVELVGDAVEEAAAALLLLVGVAALLLLALVLVLIVVVTADSWARLVMP